MKNDKYDLVLYFPPDFAKRLDEFHRELAKRAGRPELAAAPLPTVPSPEIFHDSVKEKSQVALARVWQIVGCWQGAIGAKNLRDSNVPQSAGKPFRTSPLRIWRSKNSKRRPSGPRSCPLCCCFGRSPAHSIRPSICAPAKRSAARWKRCCAARPSARKSSLESWGR